MGKELERYFGQIDLTQIVGDKLSFAFIYEVNNTNVSQTDYTISSKLRDRFGTVVTTFTTAKSTTTVTDDTITISAVPGDLPTEEGTYYYDIQRTLTADADDIQTIVRGKTTFIKQTTF